MNFTQLKATHIINTIAALQVLRGQLTQPHTTKTNHSDSTTQAAHTFNANQATF